MCGPCAGALLGHQLIEAGGIDLEASLLRHKLGQIDGEAVCIVKLECVVAGDGFVFGMTCLIGSIGENLKPPVECSAEACFFGFDYGGDVIGAGFYFRERLAEAIIDGGDKFEEERVVQAKLSAEP